MSLDIPGCGRAGEESRRRLTALSRGVVSRRARTHARTDASKQASTRDVRTFLDDLEPREEEFGARWSRPYRTLLPSQTRVLAFGRTSRNVSSHSRTLSHDVFTISRQRGGERERKRERQSAPDAVVVCIGASRERTIR